MAANRPIVTFEDFVAMIARGSRQTLTTMGKPIAVTPHRSQGAWVFRNRDGDDVPLRELYDQLQMTVKGIDWLSAPILQAEQNRRRELERNAAATGFVKQSFRFLADEFGYSEPFEIPAHEDTYIIAFRNDAAARQVEISGRFGGNRFHCEIRRLVNGEPGSYERESISHAELERVREPAAAAQSEYRSFDEAVSHYGALLRRHADVLRGDGWIDHRVVAAVFARDFLETFGFRPDPDPPGWLANARPIAKVLVERYGFELVHDSDTLSPHEGELWYTLVYRRGDTTVEVVLGDIRMDEWSVRFNGETVHSFTPFSKPELFAAIAAIERML